jgi:2-polyprenyl-3-methyl-5-hydroxy-6-metoxy-1,4-benzoquinol methylase
MPVPQRLEDHYGIAPEKYWTEDSYFEQDPNYFQQQISRYETLSQSAPGRQPGARALDIGAGIGKTMLALSRAGFDVHGVEASPSFHRAAIERMNIPTDRLQLAMVEDAEFDPESFDFINLGAVLEHLYDPAGVLERSIPWLKPNGLMHIEVPSSSYLMSSLVRWFYRLTGSDYVINTCPMHAPFHLYEFHPLCFRLHGQSHAYSVVHQECYVCDSYTPRRLHPLFAGAMRMTGTGMQLVVWLKKGVVATQQAIGTQMSGCSAVGVADVSPSS